MQTLNIVDSGDCNLFHHVQIDDNKIYYIDTFSAGKLHCYDLEKQKLETIDLWEDINNCQELRNLVVQGNRCYYLIKKEGESEHTIDIYDIRKKAKIMTMTEKLGVDIFSKFFVLDDLAIWVYKPCSKKDMIGLMSFLKKQDIVKGYDCDYDEYHQLDNIYNDYDLPDNYDWHDDENPETTHDASNYTYIKFINTRTGELIFSHEYEDTSHFTNWFAGSTKDGLLCLNRKENNVIKYTFQLNEST